MQESAAGLQASHEMMTQEITAMVKALRQALVELRARTSELETAAGDYPAAGQHVVAALTELCGKIAEVRDEFGAVVVDARAASAALSAVAGVVERNTEQVNDGVAQRAHSLQKELAAIDAVVSEFVDVMRVRMQYDSGPELG
jgi:ABC-type transporter Mla subunit MlaD